MTVIRDTGASQRLVADLRASISACTAVRLGIATHVEKEKCLRENERNGKQSTQRLMKSTGRTSAALYAYPPELRDVRSGVLGCRVVDSSVIAPVCHVL